MNKANGEKEKNKKEREIDRKNFAHNNVGFISNLKQADEFY